MKKLLLILLCFTGNFCFAQSNDLPNREAFTLKMPIDSENFYSANITQSPYIGPENTIQIYSGEKLFIEIELKRKKIISMKSVKENLHPEKTLIISFFQNTEGKKHKSMMLKIHNPFEYTLKYDALIYLVEYDKWISTNVRPVNPQISSYETWVDVISTIGLSNWEFK